MQVVEVGLELQMGLVDLVVGVMRTLAQVILEQQTQAVVLVHLSETVALILL
jgi:hypothetical protein